MLKIYIYIQASGNTALNMVLNVYCFTKVLDTTLTPLSYHDINSVHPSSLLTCTAHT